MARYTHLAAALGVLLLEGTAHAQLAPAPVGPTCVPAPQDPLVARRLRPLGDVANFPLCTHVDQLSLHIVPFRRIFDAGDALFGAVFNELDGVGANLSGDPAVSLRFSRVPRADQPGFVNRATGPNGQSCAECHNLPIADAAGAAPLNVFRDPRRTGTATGFIQRNTPHLFGGAGLQLVAEEMTEELAAVREATRTLAVRSRTTITIPLRAKGVDFGTLTALPGGLTITVNSSSIDRDLVVRPFQWKGNVASERDFVRDASHQELGMQGEELAGVGVDADGDGVVNEFTVGDMTALSTYMAAQPTPRRASALAAEGLAPPLATRVAAAVTAGEQLFTSFGCVACHTPTLKAASPLYREPSRLAAYRDATFPSGADPVALGVDPASPVWFDLRTDVFPPWPTDPVTGEVVVELFSDLRRHDMGPGLAEGIDETGVGASVFLTRPLWGVGQTPPYLHDGRAPTLSAAIRFHGGEAAASRDAFVAASAADQANLVEFLKDLVLFNPAPGAALP